MNTKKLREEFLSTDTTRKSQSQAIVEKETFCLEVESVTTGVENWRFKYDQGIPCLYAAHCG